MGAFRFDVHRLLVPPHKGLKEIMGTYRLIRIIISNSHKKCTFKTAQSISSSSFSVTVIHTVIYFFAALLLITVSHDNLTALH